MPEPPSEFSGSIQSIRRSVTLPTKLNPQARRGSGAPNIGENVIFYHPSAKIVHFAPRALVPIPSSTAPTDFDYPVDTIETLPWRSASERTVATAPLRLERVHGLTVFLKCGNVVHAILKNSQCWCVDGVSKFVLRIRPLTYYRIELPYETEEDKISVGDLKVALPTVLRYEVTPCPFKRAFTVEIPEDAMAPRRKKAWRPKDRKDSLLSALNSNQSSPSEGRSEWLDSASTGDDTDGGATDDSSSNGPKAAKSTTPELSPAGDQSPIFTNTFELPIRSKSTRRSVTEIPHTFTSLRAKFDSSPVPGESSIPEERLAPNETETSGQDSASELAPDSEEAPVLEDRPISPGPPVQEDASAQDDVPTPRKISAQDNTSIQEETLVKDEASTVQETNPVAASLALRSGEEPSTSTEASASGPAAPEDDPSTETEPQIEGSITKAVVSEVAPVPHECLASENPVVLGETSASDTDYVTDTPAADELPVPAEATVAVESHVRNLSDSEVPISKPHLFSDREPEADHDDSLLSTPDSFHSADLTSPSDSISTHTTPEKHRDITQSATYPSQPPEKFPAHKLDVSPVQDTSRSNGSPVVSPNFAYYEFSERPSKPSLAIPPNSKKDSQPIAKGASPPTDFNHMSTEFRRRAQATRQRDVSPMPPPSAIYQPNPGAEAKSILSKTLALVLVPPISLFIILLHITARIVISPAATLSSGESGSRSRSSKKEPVTEEDDFSFPLEREPSSEYEDAEITRKLDPWDLD
ncbi:uncharacterized protein N7498_007171 [Penicillium cinerascens]|uniref:Inheritance of peroxisomes protein 1 n=1 Tax=Penicillium cinerascens TaxID=70096 RepID=A0A9W9MDR1_9EURO|nr:uncharacterized protein N7498_007171 [Penicillium cinerascens]KAJ5198054.1 hypothetical protein N7498_007171 [Penicillium cinerascens]